LQILRILERTWTIYWREFQTFRENSESHCQRF